MKNFNQKELDQLVHVIQKEVKELETSDGWETIAEGKVKGYKKKTKTNSIITRAETIINFAVSKVIDFFMKNDSMQKLNDMVLQNKLLHEKQGKYKIFHIQMKTPFPLDNREDVALTTWINEGDKFYMAVKSCNYPFQANPNFVRATMNIGGWIFEKIDANSTKVTNIADMDPNGNIPDFVKNMVAEKRIQGLKDLEGVLKKQGY